ncbi:unnamed protein product [Plutella xylostella]|uniref:(diamondback moth) hypothetical protein n=1 Tax=Plutella xylostella TaxID=51655 RepID=A0A8S4EEY8_PLUXY|nr:unnamed protein product [Plutella xylostella]
MADQPGSPDELEMLKALYDFEATLSKTLSFTEGEFFFLQQTNSKQRNWWHVVNRKGQMGFVPSNYVVAVKVEPDFAMSFLNNCIKSLNDDNVISSHKQELLARLTEKRKIIQLSLKPPSKKPPAPKPPPRLDDHTPPNGVSPSFDLRPVVSQQHVTEELDQSPTTANNNLQNEINRRESLATVASQQLSSDAETQDDSQDSSDGIRPNAIYEIVQSVRKETQLSHEMSKVAVETVLTSLREWPVFKNRLEQFIKLNGIKEDSKGALLITYLSDDTYRLARNLLHPKVLENVKFEDLVLKLDEHFTPKRCLLAERQKFYEARKAAGESIQEWAVRVRGLAVYCEFGTALDQLLRDRFVLGLSAGAERDRLFEVDAEKLTFTKAQEVAQQAASARQARAAAVVKEEPVYRVSGARAGPAAASRAPAGDDTWRCAVCRLKNHDAIKCRFKNYRCQSKTAAFRGSFKYQATKCWNNIPPPLRKLKSKHLFKIKLRQYLTCIDGVSCWLDDVAITGPTKDIHLARLREVLSRMRDAGLRLQKEKCVFFQESVTYLGYVISKNGLSTCKKKVEAILEAPRPKNTLEVKRFLGVVNYYRNFVPNASAKLSPLHDLLRANAKWEWGESQENAFTSVKNELACDRMLAHFDPDAQLVLTVDAGPQGLGAVLAQLDAAGTERPLAFASRSLSTSERNYSQIQKEATAIVYGVKHFHQYLYGRQEPFILKTDHQPLLSIFGNKAGISVMTALRLQRYAILLSAYNYKIQYIKTDKNVVADYFSRAPPPQPEPAAAASTGEDYSYLKFLDTNVSPVKFHDIQKATKSDRVLQIVIKYMNHGWPRKVTYEKETHDSLPSHSQVLVDDDVTSSLNSPARSPQACSSSVTAVTSEPQHPPLRQNLEEEEDDWAEAQEEAPSSVGPVDEQAGAVAETARPSAPPEPADGGGLSSDVRAPRPVRACRQKNEFLPGGAARSIIDALLREANSNFTCPKNAIDAAPDAVRMITSLNALSKAANDAQQRGWALHDDAHDIQTQLLELISVMSNADVNISQHVLSSHRYGYVTTLVQYYQQEKRWPLRQLLLQSPEVRYYGYVTTLVQYYQQETRWPLRQLLLQVRRYGYVTTLVQYYQQETRWPLRQLLLQAFGVMCGLERVALATLALSQLPAEIARDMRDNPRAVGRLSHCALLLSMLLSMADPLPVTHFEILGVEFAQFLLQLVENPPDTDVDEQIPDLFLTLLLAYNLQFEGAENLLLDALERQDQAKTFCEKVLLLLNREEDPVRIFDHEPEPPHSVLKLVTDVFSRKKTADHFYTNDVKVAIDIVVRQLADLSAGDERRQDYLKILQGVIRNTAYGSHLHRRDDVLRCFARIFCEEGAASRRDQALVRALIATHPTQHASCDDVLRCFARIFCEEGAASRRDQALVRAQGCF